MRAVQIERFVDPARFFARVSDFLARHEGEHNLMLGFRSSLERDPHSYGAEDPYLAALTDGQDVVAAAVRTPPHNLVLSRASVQAVERLLDDLVASEANLPGVFGPVASTERFARGWSAARGVTTQLATAERVYEATVVVPPPAIDGRMRACDEDDRSTAVTWMNAFFAEAMPGANDSDAEGFVTRRLTHPDEGLVVWDHDGPVSLAGFAGPTPNGIRIGPVYTPPELRGRGYASALTAALTQELLASGRRSCLLFTDLANPTSNAIYQRIGYRPLGDLSLWSFGRS
jgi:uncharacterized protein